MRTPHTHSSSGITIVLMVVFLGVFSVITSALVGYVFMQANLGRAKQAREQALQAAEAGLEYYRWFLAHNPNDLDDTGGSEPYEHVVNDPEGGEVGTYRLTIDGTAACGVVYAIDITSEGESHRDSRFKRTLKVHYAQPTVAEYSYVVNSNVWAGSDRQITGPYHSNGGIRMDGTNNSDVTSSVATWTCTSGFGCTPNQTQPGVFGAGPGFALWKNAQPQVDFAGIAADFNVLKGYAQAHGLFFAKHGGGGNARGYRMVLNSNGTVDVYRVTGTNYVNGMDASGTWERDYDLITAQTYMGRYTIPSDCPIIFSEGKVWIEGTAAKKMLIVAADPASDTPDIILTGNINYTATDGTVGVTMIAERDIRIALLSPENMTIRGIFIAQGGAYGRNYYTTSGSYQVPSSYDSYVMQNTLTTYGSVVTNGRTGTSWTCSGVFCSGYANRVDSFDRLLAFDPPPFTPISSADFRFVQWREQ